MSTAKQIKTFETFLEGIAQYCPDKELMETITNGFRKCHPLHEGIVEDVKTTLGNFVKPEKIDGFAKVVAKGMEAAGVTDVKEFVKKALSMNPTEDFAEEAVGFLGEAVLTEGVGDKIGKIAKIMAVAAMLASGAMANESAPSDSTTQTTAPTAQKTFDSGDTSQNLDSFLKGALGDKAMDFLKKKNAKSTSTAQALGQTAKAAAGVGNN